MFNVHVEFWHASQGDSQHLGAAGIHQYLLRTYDSVSGVALVKDLTVLFADLAHLETVVLKTGDHCGQVQTHNIQSMIEALRKACRAEITIEHRTCEDALTLALQAKKSTARPPGAPLLSPFWCLPTRDESWERW